MAYTYLVFLHLDSRLTLAQSYRSIPFYNLLLYLIRYFNNVLNFLLGLKENIDILLLIIRSRYITVIYKSCSFISTLSITIHNKNVRSVRQYALCNHMYKLCTYINQVITLHNDMRFVWIWFSWYTFIFKRHWHLNSNFKTWEIKSTPTSIFNSLMHVC